MLVLFGLTFSALALDLDPVPLVLGESIASNAALLSNRIHLGEQARSSG